MEVASAAAIDSGVCRQFYDLIEVQYMWCVRVCCNVRLKEKTRGIAVSQQTKNTWSDLFWTFGRHIMWIDVVGLCRPKRWPLTRVHWPFIHLHDTSTFFGDDFDWSRCSFRPIDCGRFVINEEKSQWSWWRILGHNEPSGIFSLNGIDEENGGNSLCICDKEALLDRFPKRRECCAIKHWMETTMRGGCTAQSNRRTNLFGRYK